jgi:hypothetical protein
MDNFINSKFQIANKSQNPNFKPVALLLVIASQLSKPVALLLVIASQLSKPVALLLVIASQLSKYFSHWYLIFI